VASEAAHSKKLAAFGEAQAPPSHRRTRVKKIEAHTEPQKEARQISEPESQNLGVLRPCADSRGESKPGSPNELII
jgi:hypothetical protein